MGFVEATKTCLRKYFTVSGRASRSEFWWFVLFQILAGVVAVVLDGIVFGWETATSDDGGPISIAVSLGLFIPYITATVRRLHDTGKPGYMMFVPPIVGGLAIGLGMVTSLGGIVWAGLWIMILGFLLVFWWLVKPSDPHANRYGPGPNAPEQGYQEVFK